MSKKNAEIFEKMLLLKGYKGLGKDYYDDISNEAAESLQAKGFSCLAEVEKYYNETKKSKKQKVNDNLYD